MTLPNDEISPEAALERAGLDPETAEPIVPAGETPAAEETPATEEKPAEEKPGEESEETPTEEEQPAAEAAEPEPTADEKLAATVAAAVAKAIAPAAKPAEPAKREAPPEIKPPAHIARLIASEDDETKALGESLFEDWKETRQTIANLQQRVDYREDTELETQLAGELAAAVPNYTMGVDAAGKPQPLDQKEVDAKLEAFATDPKTAALSVAIVEDGGMEALLRYLYPGAVKKAQSPAPAKGGGPNHDGSNRNVRRVPGSPRTQPAALAAGGGGNARPAQAKPSAAPQNEDPDVRLDRIFKELAIE